VLVNPGSKKRKSGLKYKEGHRKKSEIDRIIYKRQSDRAKAGDVFTALLGSPGTKKAA